MKLIGRSLGWLSAHLKAFRPPLKHRLAGWILLFGSALASVWLFADLSRGRLVPGLSIGALAVVAACATLIEIDEWARFFLIGLCACFLWMEARSIEADRMQQEAAHRADQDKLNERFRTVLRENQLSEAKVLSNARAQFADTLSHFADLVGEDRHLEQLSKENLLSLTGGDSFPYVVPQPPDNDGSIRLIAWNTGNYPLTGMTITIHRVTEMPWTDTEQNIGTIPAHGLRELTYRVHPTVGDRGLDSYWIFFDAQNGQSNEMLQFRRPKSGNGWANEFTVDQSELPCDRFAKGARRPGFQGTLMFRPWSDEQPVAGAPHVIISKFRPGCVSFDRR